MLIATGDGAVKGHGELLDFKRSISVRSRRIATVLVGNSLQGYLASGMFSVTAVISAVLHLRGEYSFCLG